MYNIFGLAFRTTVINMVLEKSKVEGAVYLVHTTDFYLKSHVFGAVPVRKKDEILD